MRELRAELTYYAYEKDMTMKLRDLEKQILDVTDLCNLKATDDFVVKKFEENKKELSNMIRLKTDMT